VSAEVRELLARAAARPRTAADYDEIDRRARARGRRRTAGRVAGLSLAAATVVAGVAAVAPRQDRGVRPAPAVSVTGVPWTDNSLPAPARTVGARVRMPLVLPDGTRVELSLPRGVDWGGMPAVPYGGVAVDDVLTSDFHVMRGGLAYFAGEGDLQRTLLTAPGRVVSYWMMYTPGGPGYYVVVDFGPWVIGIWGVQRLKTEEQLRALAENLTGTVTDDGFLVLRPTGPVRLLGPGSGAAPTIHVGDLAGTGLSVTAEPCTRDTTWLTGTREQSEAGACRPGWGVTVRVHGPRDIVKTFHNDIELRRYP
jgi:hypothetical protein